MFLDSEASSSRAWRSQVLAVSPYSALDLEEILITEVYPICWSKLNAAVDERLAFAPGALEAMILRREASPEIVARLVELARQAVPRSREWQATKAAIASLRSRRWPGLRPGVSCCGASRQTAAPTFFGEHSHA